MGLWEYRWAHSPYVSSVRSSQRSNASVMSLMFCPVLLKGFSTEKENIFILNFMSLFSAYESEFLRKSEEAPYLEQRQRDHVGNVRREHTMAIFMTKDFLKMFYLMLDLDYWHWTSLIKLVMNVRERLHPKNKCVVHENPINLYFHPTLIHFKSNKNSCLIKMKCWCIKGGWASLCRR